MENGAQTYFTYFTRACSHAEICPPSLPPLCVHLTRSMDQLHQGALSPNAGVPLDGPLSDIPSSPNEHSQVNIIDAKAAFAELEHRLSITTHNSENGVSIVDPEKGEPDRFALREYMQSTNDANTANGISHKHVGITWSSLSVVVTGFESQKVCHIRSRYGPRSSTADRRHYFRESSPAVPFVSLLLAFGTMACCLHEKARRFTKDSRRVGIPKPLPSDLL